MKTVVKMQFGSHLYGTNTPQSDTDLKGVHIPSAKEILLQQVKEEIVVGGRDKVEGERNTPTDVDDKSYSLQKFMKLASEGQTVAIDMLFAPNAMIEESSGWWRYIVQNRYRLISRKSAAFLGYCRQQANKYGIKGSRVAAARDFSKFFTAWCAPTHPPTDGKAVKVQDIHSLMEYIVARHPEHAFIVEQEIGSSGQTGKFLDVCGRKVSFTAPIRQAAEIYTRIFENYGDRALKAESSEGVDWKALSHAVRVGEEALELLTTGNVTFPLPNAKHILAIKQGQLSYQDVSTEIEDLLVKVEDAAKSSTLPDEPDHAFIEKTILDAYGNAVWREHVPAAKELELYGSRPMVDKELDQTVRWAAMREMAGWPNVDCHQCWLSHPAMTPWNRPFIVCSKCGNKRCPKATDHNLECTGSNEPGQKGSRYE